MIKNKEWPYLKYLDVNNLYGWAMSQNFPLNCFKWFEDLSRFDEGFVKSFVKKAQKYVFSKLIFNMLKIIILPERTKIGKVEELVANLYD